MTQAFNLALLGNKVNTSGSLNAATGLYNATPVANGGTGAATLTANNVLLGNGTSAVQTIAPGTSGNVLQSNGTTWASAAPPAPNTAQVLSATAAASGGAVGTYSLLFWNAATTQSVPGTTVAGSSLAYASSMFSGGNSAYAGSAPSGTWRLMGAASAVGGCPASDGRIGLWLRIS